MILEAIVNGRTFVLTERSLCTVRAVEGVGPAPLHRLEQRGPLQHGVSDVGMRLDARVVTLLLMLWGESRLDLERRRQALTAVFPPDEVIQLRWTLESGAVRQLDCRLVDMPLAFERENFLTQLTAAALKAADPTFYDPAGAAAAFLPASGSGAGSVPMPVPHEVGSASIQQTTVIRYPGTWIAYPVIRVTGPITDAKITHEGSGDVLDFDGLTLGSGEWIEIDCRYGRKTVIDQAGVNRLEDLTQDSDLATFHLERARAGETERENVVTVSGSGAGVGTRVDMTYYHRYLGL